MAWYSSIFGRSRGKVPKLEDSSTVPADSRLRSVREVPGLGGAKFASVGFDAGFSDSRTRMGRIRAKLRHAFTPASPVQDVAMLSGRSEVLRNIIRAIEDLHLHVIVYGERGIGKTSLLHVLTQNARDAGYSVHYASCSEDVDIGELFRGVFQSIPLLYHVDLDPTAEQVEEGLTFADLLPPGPLTVPVITQLLSKLDGTRMLLVLDEFDRGHGAFFRRSVAEIIKNLSDRSIPVQLVIGGVAANLTELIEHIPAIRRNILGLPLPNMRNDEIVEMMTKAEALTGLSFPPDVSQMICKVSGGLPYLASLVCHHTALAAIDRQSEVLSGHDLATALAVIEGETRGRLSYKATYTLDQLQNLGADRVVSELACIALENSGRIPPSHIASYAGNEGLARELLGALEDYESFLQVVPDDPSGAYAFVEESVPLYLWIVAHRRRGGVRALPIAA